MKSEYLNIGKIREPKTTIHDLEFIQKISDYYDTDGRYSVKKVIDKSSALYAKSDSAKTYFGNVDKVGYYTNTDIKSCFRTDNLNFIKNLAKRWLYDITGNSAVYLKAAKFIIIDRQDNIEYILNPDVKIKDTYIKMNEYE